MNYFRLVAGDQNFTASTMLAASVTVPPILDTRLITATNACVGTTAFKNLQADLEAGNATLTITGGDDVTDGSADGYFVLCPARPNAIAYGTTGNWNGSMNTFDMSEGPLESLAGVDIVLSPFPKLAGATISDFVKALPPETTHVAWRWTGTDELKLQPQCWDGDSRDTWPSLPEGAQGTWHVGDLELLTVYCPGGVGGRLQLIALQEEGRMR